MELQLDDILSRIFFKNYSEAKEISEELNRILLDKNLTDPQIAYFSSRIFNSPQNLFNFIDQNTEDKDRDCTNLRKYLFETISSYIKERKGKVTDYLTFIKDGCLRLFKKDCSNTVKEASLHPIVKILKYYDGPKIKDLFDCDHFAGILLDEIKIFRQTAGVRARIWQVLGLLTKAFPAQMAPYQVEIQDVMFGNLNEQMNSSKPEQNAIAGMLKAYVFCLEDNHLTSKQIAQLYLILKVTMNPIEQVKRYSVPINALRLFEKHHKLFKQYIIKDTEELYENFMKVVSHTNTSVRETGSEAFEAFIRELAEGLNDETLQKDKFSFLMKKFGAILDTTSSDTISITLVIRSVGIFSKAMKIFLGEASLKKFFSKLIDLSEQKVIRIFRQTMQEEKGEKSDTFNFGGTTYKQILYKQRLLYSFLNSFALLIGNVKDINDRESNHLYELALLGLQYNLKFFSGYREHLYDGIASLIMALSYHQTVFLFWLKKLISQGMLQTLKIPDNVYYAGEDYHLSLKFTCELWLGLLDRPKIWSETCCKIFYDEIMLHINDLMNSLDLGYKIKHANDASEDGPQPELSYINTMEYVPNNMNDAQYMYRIALFADEFFWKSKKNWLTHWIPFLLRSVIYKLRVYPRCIALLKILTTLNEIMEDMTFFTTQAQAGGDKDLQELCKIYYKELFEKYKEYQDELLNDALKVLLSVPSYFIINDTEQVAKNLTLAVKRALQVGLLNIWLAYAAVTALDRLVQKLPKKKAMTFLTFITPLLSDFMIYEKGSQDTTDPNITKFNLKMRETTITRKQVSDKVVEFLGGRGGLNHLIIPSEFRDLAIDKNLAKEFIENKALVDFKRVNLISWDHENVFTFPLPLYNKKIDIDLIKVIPKVVEIASTSTDRKMKVTACELLHALIIYMIGKSAQQPGGGKTKSKTNFSNLYTRIFPVIFTIASDPEDISTKIFNTLCLQIVRWFSSSKDYENKETACLLDTLMNCVSVKDNSNLRDFAAVCIGEFIKWSIKQTTSQQLRENYGNIKSVIRRIENNSNYPDIYYRYGAVLALKHVIIPMREESFLVEKYILEIAQVILNIVKMSAYTQNLTEEMKENMSYVIKKVREVIIKRWDLVDAVDIKRGGFESIYQFIEWLYTQLLSYETDYREKILYMWEGFVDEIVKHKKKGITSHKEWILNHAGGRSLFKECKNLEFDAGKFVGDDLQEKVDLVRKNNKLLDAQLHIYAIFINKGYLTFDEVKKYQDFLIFAKNVQLFFASLTRPAEVGRTQQQRIIDNDPQLFKSKLSTLLHIFTFLTQSLNMQQFVQIFLSNTFNKRNLFYKIFQTLISPFEDVEINPTYNIKADRYRIITCSTLLTKLKESEKELQDEAKFFEEYYYKDFLKDYPKFDLTSNQSFLRNLFTYTEFQIKSFFQGYEGLYQDFMSILTKPRFHRGFVGTYIRMICEALLKFIDQNLPRIETNQEEKLLILLKFALKFNPDIDFIMNLINEDNPIFQKFQVEILDCLARKWQYDEGELTGRILQKAKDEGLMNRLLIPLTQRVIRFVPNFLTKIAGELSKQDFVGATDEVINNFTKFYYVLLSKVAKQKFLQNRAAFKKFLHKFILEFLNPKKTSLKTVLEVINLFGLYVSELDDEYSSYHGEIMEALEPLQSKYFPIKTEDLVPDSPDDVNFKLVLTALMNTIIVTNRVELLKVMYSIIREKECVPKYEKKLQDFCTKLVKGLASRPFEDHVGTFSQLFAIFMDKYVDDQMESNLRWQIMHRVAFPYLEELPLNSLEDIMIKHGLIIEGIITKDNFKDVLTNFEKTVEVLQEKSLACKCMEIFYRRLPGDVLKNKISKKLYGEGSPKELHKTLIIPLHNGKRKPLDQKDFLLNHEMNKKFNIEPVMRHYHCMCYSALCMIIGATQTKEGPFNTFLFQVTRDKGDHLWEILLEKKEDFSFEVQTNFNVTTVERTEDKLKKTLAAAQLNQIIASKYLTESFFSQRSDHHGFLVMEFDPTQGQKKQNKSNENGEEVEPMEVESDSQENKNINPLQIDFNPQPKTEEQKKQVSKEVEVDKINLHPCMFNVLRVIDNLQQNFPAVGGTMPGWMTALHTEALRSEATLFIKIFIIKIVINREEVFRPFAKEWSEVLFDYCMQKNNGGKGFHYFLRDVCTTLLTWHSQGFKLDESLENKKICNEILSNLMKVAADKQSLIFRSNLKILVGLMDHWRKNLVLDKDLVQKMLNFDETKDGAHLWRMTTLQVLDVALNFKIPLGAKGNYQNLDQVAQWDDNLLASVMKNMRFSSRHQVPFLASAVCGKILLHLANLSGQGAGIFGAGANGNVTNPAADKRLKEVEKLTTKFLMSLGDKEDDKFAYFLENITLAYPRIITGEVFYKCQNRIHTLTKKPRGAIFNAWRIFIEKAPNLIAIQDEIRDICLCLRGSFDQIVRDYNEGNLINFFRLLHQISQLNSDQSRDLIKDKIEALAKTFLETSSENIVEIFFNIVTYIYDQNDDELKNITKNFLLKGLNHNLPSIRSRIFDFLNHENRVSLNPSSRMLVTLNDLYAPESENLWLRSTVPLMVSIAKKSSDYDRKLFDAPLERTIQFKDFDPSQSSQGFRFVNRSQPLTPIFTLSQQKFEEAIDTAMSVETKAQTDLSATQAFLRATQLPMFSQTLVSTVVEEENTDNPYGISYTQNAQAGDGARPANRGSGVGAAGADGKASPAANIMSTLSETMIATGSRRGPRDNALMSFMATNDLKFQNVSSVGSNKVRYAPEGQQTSQLTEIRAKQRMLFNTRQVEIRKKQISASRKYRIGELPDIEIAYKDVIDPLVQLAQEDAEISSELFISIVCDLYKMEDNKEIAKDYLNSLKRILNLTEQFNYSVISTIHRAFLELIKRDSGVQIDADAVAKSGLRSYSYHTTVLLLEEILIAGNEAADLEKLKKQKKTPSTQRPRAQDASRNLNQVEFKEDLSQVWLHLIEIYGALNEDDGVRGLLSIVMNDERVREALDFKLNQNYGRSVNLFNELLDEYQNDESLKTNLNKKIYEYVAEEKRESLAALGKWDIILKETDYDMADASSNTIPINSLKENDALYLVKGLIYNDDYWPTMNDYVSSWRENEKMRYFVDTRFSWEMGLLSITQKDYDRAKYFVTLEKDNFVKKWEKLDLFSEAAKHDQLQHLQKIAEFEEFLGYIEKTRHAPADVIKKELVSMTQNWLKRPPSTTYDSVHTWNDILFAREMFCNVISYKHFGENESVVENIVADLYIESARGLLKRGVLENADSLLNKAIRIKNKETDQSKRQFEYKAISSVIKLKLRILENDESKFTQDIGAFLPRYNQIVTVLESQQKRYEGRIDEYNLNKLQMLKIYAKEKALSFLYETYFLAKDDGGDYQDLINEMAVYGKFINETFNAIFHSNYFTLTSLNQGSENTAYRGKIYHRHATFAEGLLRIYEESFDPKQPMNTNPMIVTFSKASVQFLPKNLAKAFMTNICEAFNLGYYKLQQLPKLFDLLLKYPELADLFKDKSKGIPAWLFLKWLPQMMFLLHAKDLSTHVDDIFIKISETYPQAILYMFNVSYDRLFQLENTQTKTPLVEKIQQRLEKFQNHYAFIQSLNQLTHPEHKLIHYYFDKVKEPLIDPSMNKAERLELVAKELWSDVFSPKKPFVNDLIGSYAAKFAKVWEKEFAKAFGNKLERIHTMDWQKFSTDKAIQDLIKKLKDVSAKIPSGYEKLSTFSTWLSTYDSNNYLYEAKIELPGQYAGNTEPFLPSHVTVSNFGQNVLTLGSLRRPKRLTVHGSNEKSYNFLVKGIEDLRLDQRIEQLFSLMNEIFLQDAECQKRDLQINTYQVVPMTKMLGILEWVDDTVPIKNLLGKELENSYQIGIDDNQARENRIKWLASIPDAKGKGIADQHAVLLGVDEKTVVEAFNTHQGFIPGFVLKKSLERLCSSPGAFLYIKNKFIRNYATLSVGSYILGIGDRHLENFLVSTSTGEVVPIDFGYSFGQGLTLPIPELMPFRLTRTIECLMQPMGVDGIFRNTMIQCFNALRESRNVILDCCEIFVKDPLMDWIKTAKNKRLGISASTGLPGSIHRSLNNPATDSLASLGIDEEIAWYPMKKVDIVRKKLLGAKPGDVMLIELQDSRFFKANQQAQFKKQKEQIIQVVNGTKGTYRATLKKPYLTTAEQVDALIDQARDPNVLGRTWIGWSPYV